MKRIINDLQKNNPVCGFAMRCFLLVCFLLAANTPAYAQTERVTINVRNVELSEVFTRIQNQTELKIFYNNEIVNAKQLVTVSVTNLTVDEALKQILLPLKMNHSFVDKTIVVANNPQRFIVKPAEEVNTIMGVVRTKSGVPLTGATVRFKTTGTSTDAQGRYTIAVPANSETMTVSYVGMVSQTFRVKGITELNVTMEEEPIVVEEMIVTGYAPKAKNSFTGTAVQVKGEELRTVNPTNLLSALKVFDPSFVVVDQEGTFGSNPNYVPERIDIRGQSSIPDISKGTLDTYTSLPIFILDGFQISVQQVFDLNMNRIKSVTILKDAAASAIYGSRAANGVVVIETTVPDNGKLSVSYALNVAVETPDLSSYNLMNASELLEYFRRLDLFNAGNKGDNTAADIYEDLLGGNPGRQNLFMLLSKEIENGVDTYWLSQPLRTALRHDHTVMLEGGTRLSTGAGPRRDMRYQINLNGSQGDGVMKGSKRDRIGGGLKLFYDTEKLRLVSNLQFSKINNADSPYGNFSDYANLFPFYRMKDSNGEYFRMLSYQNIPIYEGFPKPDFTGNVFQPQSNPLYEAKYLSSFNKGETTDITYNMGLNWLPLDGLRVAGAFSVNNVQSSQDTYRSPLSPDFYDGILGVGNIITYGFPIENLYQRGTYVLYNRSDMRYNGRLDISYLRSFDKHTIQAVAGAELNETSNESDQYTSVGFFDDPTGYPSYAIQFKPDSGPSGSKGITRNAGAYFNMNYSWSERYLLDLMGRLDGSSNFASQKRTAPFWSTGVRWNVHNESFMKNTGFLQKLALKGSIGTAGNQNFQLSQIMMMYRYLGSYNGVLGADIMSLANESLKWQTSLKRNIGIELSMLEGMINFDGSFYRETTKDNLTDVKILNSTGFTTYKANQGDVENKGFEFALIVTPIRTRDWILSFTLRGAHNENKLMRLSDALKEYNESVKAAQAASVGVSGVTKLDRVFLLEEGRSLNTIYAVRSLGIDPATGQEVYLTRNGEKTFLWNAADQVAVGVDEPKLKGSFGFNLFYKRWHWSTNFEYSFGADRFNTTLYERMEGANFSSNLDRRALTERWTKPGDIAKYRAYTNLSQGKISSRFVQRENYLSLTSMTLTYKLIRENVKYLGLSDLTISLSTNELFYSSTIKRERGLSYPFARTFNFTLRANF